VLVLVLEFNSGRCPAAGRLPELPDRSGRSPVSNRSKEDMSGSSKKDRGWNMADEFASKKSKHNYTHKRYN
jgi:hypothetical protein